jgi:hypothetical protein
LASAAGRGAVWYPETGLKNKYSKHKTEKLAELWSEYEYFAVVYLN